MALDDLLKILKTNGPKAVLDKVQSPEIAATLKGNQRLAYLKALDDVYGDRELRAKNMGFNAETWYHGTNQNISEFDPLLSNTKRKTGVPESSMFFSDSPDVANSYSDQVTSGFTGNKTWKDTGGVVYPVKLKMGKSKKVNAKGENWNAINDPKTGENLTINDIVQIAKNKGKQSVLVKNVKDFGEGYGFRDKATTAAVFKPNQIRSKFAAFDPRFENSSNLLAGSLAAPAFSNPLEMLEDVASKYRKAQNKAADYVYEQITPKSIPRDEMMKESGRIALDPINLVEGPLGFLLNTIMMAPEAKK